jgi:peptide/nickel transport system substrate-binding protein
MGGASPFTKAFLVIIVIILLVGFYVTIDAKSLTKKSNEALVDEIRGIRGELANLRKQIEEGGFVGGEARPRSKRVFANMDIRDPKAEDGDAVISPISAETPNLNTIINNESMVSTFWGMCNDSLAARNMKEPTRFEPQLAESWEASDDNLTYTIHLRKGVRWHDFIDPITKKEFKDREVTAHDFKFYIDVIRNPKIPCDAIRVYYKDLKALEVIDDYTFKVVWKDPYFLSKEFTLGLAPLPRHFYQFDPKKVDAEFTENHERNRMIVGCGPWVFKSWAKNKEIVFVRNDQYYGPKPSLKRRVFRVIKEPNAQLAALINKGVDMVGLQPEQWLDQTNSEKFKENFHKLKYTSRSYSYIGYNMRRPLFQDKRVRRALTHLVDRERILRDIYRGMGRLITNNFFVDSPYYDHNIKPYEYSLEKARKLLAEAGWRDTDGDGVLDKDGVKFEFVFASISSSKINGRIAVVMQEGCKKVGINMTINPYEWSIYLKKLEDRDFDVCSLGWRMGYESDPYQIWHSDQITKKKSSNHVSFSNAEADKIIETARREFDLDKRIKLYNRFAQIIHEEQPYTFLIAPYSLVAADRRYRNVETYPLGINWQTWWVPRGEQKHRN